MTLLQNRKKHVYLVAILFALILVLALILHYSIHIENALTSQPAEGFSVQVHTLRIIFEPVFGPLLFYLRADQPLVEMLVLMLWAIIALFVISFWKAFRNRKNSFLHTFWTGLKNWLVRVPILIIIWVALILIIIFLPLPSNTIVNHLHDTILLNTHSHTYYSHDGLISQKNLMRWHKRNGFDAFFITDHNNHLKTLEFVQAQKMGKIPESPLVFCGEEYSGSNHITLLGLQRDFKTKDMPDSTAIDSAHANGGVGIIAHWFADEHRTIQYYIDCGADGFEIANQAEGLTYSRRIFRAIVEKCRENGLLMVGACDYHGYGSAAFTWNALEIPGWQNLAAEQKRSSIMNIFRQHEESKIKVLVYRDRYVFPRKLVFLSPIFNLGYFRTLDVWQIVSWILWILFLPLVASIGFVNKAGLWLRHPPQRIWGVLGFISSMFAIVIGAVLLSKVGMFKEYNNILKEYGSQFLGVGIVLGIYSLIIASRKTHHSE